MLFGLHYFITKLKTKIDVMILSRFKYIFRRLDLVDVDTWTVRWETLRLPISSNVFEYHVILCSLVMRV